MNVDATLSTFNRCGADYVLIGGMNFFLVHHPVATFDVDLWIHDTAENRQAVHAALVALEAEVSLSPRGDDWRRLRHDEPADWLQRQAFHCLVTAHGPVDVFRFVPGLEGNYETLCAECPVRTTPSGVSFRSLSDRLMISCQLALPEAQRKQDRLRALGHPA